MVSSATGDVISRHNVHFVVALIAVGCQTSPIHNGRNTEKIWSPSGPNELDEREMITELRTAPFGSLSRSSFLNSLTEM